MQVYWPLFSLSPNLINDIQSVTEFNFLGLYLNSKLNWDTHINVIGKKISRAVGIIKKLQLIFPQKMLISLYNTL